MTASTLEAAGEPRTHRDRCSAHDPDSSTLAVVMRSSRRMSDLDRP